MAMEKVDLKMRKIIFFDGVCHLCNGFIDTVISRDSDRKFLYAPLQGTTAQELLSPLDQRQLDSVIYFENNLTFYRSTAVLKILQNLGGVYRIAMLGWLLPRPARDFIYDCIAKNRYLWFGKRDLCRIPTIEERAYLLP